MIGTPMFRDFEGNTIEYTRGTSGPCPTCKQPHLVTHSSLTFRHADATIPTQTITSPLVESFNEALRRAGYLAAARDRGDL